MGIPEIAKRSLTLCNSEEDPREGEVPEGFTPVTVARIQCYTNDKQAKGDVWYGDGSKLTPEVGGRVVYRAMEGRWCH